MIAWSPFTTSAKTDVQKKTLSPVWEDPLEVTATVPGRDVFQTQRLLLVVHDYDRVGRDDFMGAAVVPLADAALTPGSKQPFKVWQRRQRRQVARSGGREERVVGGVVLLWQCPVRRVTRWSGRAWTLGLGSVVQLGAAVEVERGGRTLW